MSFFSLRHSVNRVKSSAKPATGTRQRGRTNRRSRPKRADKSWGVFETLEFRQTVSDTFFAGLQAAGVGVLGARAGG